MKKNRRRESQRETLKAPAVIANCWRADPEIKMQNHAMSLEKVQHVMHVVTCCGLLWPAVARCGHLTICH